jgi:hypothetical protein
MTCGFNATDLVDIFLVIAHRLIVLQGNVCGLICLLLAGWPECVGQDANEQDKQVHKAPAIREMSKLIVIHSPLLQR